MIDFRSKRLCSYSAIPYLASLAASIALIWLGADSYAIATQTSWRIVTTIVAVCGVMLSFASILALWILISEVVEYQVQPDGSVVLDRIWLKPLDCVKQIGVVMKLGCVFRAPKGLCVRYVVLRADRKLVPMSAELYSRLAAIRF
jgi:hypothetical protein